MKLVKRILFLTFCTLLCCNLLKASDTEGMWLPFLLNQSNYTDMKDRGLKLSSEELYSINQACLMDAIAMLGDGSASLISANGLLLTNRHVIHQSLQELSDDNRNIIENGYWSKDMKEDLPIDIEVSFLKEVKDVSKSILDKVLGIVDKDERNKLISAEIERLIGLEPQEQGKEVVIEEFFGGESFYMFIYRTYSDLRLVAVPPSSISDFGGEEDNWSWPRHNSDFAILRVYTGDQGIPAPFSKANIPHQPEYYLPISTSGVKKNEFVMTWGFPGVSHRHATSGETLNDIDHVIPIRLKMAEIKRDAINRVIEKDSGQRFKYFAQLDEINNELKLLKGTIEEFRKQNVLSKKLQREENLRAKYSDSAKFQSLQIINSTYQKINNYAEADILIMEGFFKLKILSYPTICLKLFDLLQDSANAEKVKEEAGRLTNFVQQSLYKSFNRDFESDVLGKLIAFYLTKIPTEFHPDSMADLLGKSEKELIAFADDVLLNSIFGDKDKLLRFLEEPQLTVLKNDSGYQLMSGIFNTFNAVDSEYVRLHQIVRKAKTDYEKILVQTGETNTYYPEANFSMRYSYGTVNGYSPQDGITYDYYTTLKGMLEKEDSQNSAFKVHSELKEIVRLSDGDAELKTAFISDLDIIGGSSGSPVLNGEGKLVGLVFDLNKEAMAGNYFFSPKQRAISNDIRYILFILKQIGQLDYIIEELSID